MTRILFEMIIVLVLIIVSGIVLADDFISISDNELPAIKEQIKKTDNDFGIYTYRIELKNKMNTIDGVNQLVNDNQYLYTKDSIAQYGIISLEKD